MLINLLIAKPILNELYNKIIIQNLVKILKMKINRRLIKIFYGPYSLIGIDWKGKDVMGKSMPAIG